MRFAARQGYANNTVVVQYSQGFMYETQNDYDADLVLDPTRQEKVFSCRGGAKSQAGSETGRLNLPANSQ
jgi:hypothetical protein